MLCPICKNEMEKGYIPGNGRYPIVWKSYARKKNGLGVKVAAKKFYLQLDYNGTRDHFITFYCSNCEMFIAPRFSPPQVDNTPTPISEEEYILQTRVTARELANQNEDIDDEEYDDEKTTEDNFRF